MEPDAFSVLRTRVDATVIVLFVGSANVAATLLAGVTVKQENLRRPYQCFISSLLLGKFFFFSGAWPFAPTDLKRLLWRKHRCGASAYDRQIILKCAQSSGKTLEERVHHLEKMVLMVSDLAAKSAH